MGYKSLYILIWTTCMQATGMWALLHISSSPAWTSETLGVPLAYVAIFPAISGGAAAIGSVFSANLISRWGTTNSLRVCLITLIVGLIAQSFGNYSMAVLGAILIGLAYALTNPAASALLTKIQSKRTNLVFSIKQSGVPFGAAAAMLWGSNASSQFEVWVTLPVVLLCTLILTCPKVSEKIVLCARTGLLTVWSNPFLARLLIVGMCFGAVQMIVLGSFPSLIELGFVSSTNSFLVLSIGNALGLVGRIFWGLTADRLNSSEKTLAIIGLTTCILIALLLIDSSTSPFVFLLTGFVAVGWNGVFHAAIRIKLNDSTSAATATVMAYLFASGLVGQIIFSTFLDHLGPIAALLASLLFVSIGTLFAFALARRQRGNT